ncbi:hypothetical protein EF847_22355 [Actinobacteria bacterium YIM 96077]|uniref:Secreted protein n=1 Tax=Phytoactinopolyspora halophila TaxID=1981511 RepID=A0A329QRH2_9ACTN|nr:hypothetical protein [Phytoactinopolyspora halophila]AYY15025.1 hypothetical protein EF847_22355 [Actinobacteria bacterium YIM 96077]RAW14209.1 hypothetical protein DPM12_11165 [Phytoactinopolyspora halophila]
MSSWIRRLGSGVLASTLVLPLTFTHAWADGWGGGSDDDSNEVEGTVDQTIVIEGDTVPGGSSTETVSVPARCWWEPFADHDTFRSFWQGALLAFPPLILLLPSPDYVDRIEEEEDPDDGMWYMANCIEFNIADFEKFLGTCQDWYPDACIPQVAVWWENTETEPPVVIQPEELALAAQAKLEIPSPEVDQNPKAAGTENTTLVNVDTGYWVTDPESVGGEDGTLTMRATIPETGTWVEVEAETNGLSISSPAGGTQCSPSEALNEWSPGEDPACAVQFERASTTHPDGFPVTAEAVWNTRWRGGIDGEQTDSGELDTITASETFNVPVAEVQSEVTTSD